MGTTPVIQLSRSEAIDVIRPVRQVDVERGPAEILVSGQQASNSEDVYQTIEQILAHRLNRNGDPRRDRLGVL